MNKHTEEALAAALLEVSDENRDVVYFLQDIIRTRGTILDKFGNDFSDNPLQCFVHNLEPALKAAAESDEAVHWCKEIGKTRITQSEIISSLQEQLCTAPLLINLTSETQRAKLRAKAFLLHILKNPNIMNAYSERVSH